MTARQLVSQDERRPGGDKGAEAAKCSQGLPRWWCGGSVPCRDWTSAGYYQGTMLESLLTGSKLVQYLQESRLYLARSASDWNHKSWINS